MPELGSTRDHPDLNRLSMLAGAVLLAYAIARFIEIPAGGFTLRAFGSEIPVTLSIDTITTLLIAGLTATGMDWLLSDHPALAGKRTFEHLMLPTLTAAVIGLPLSQLPVAAYWWVGFTAGAVLLILVMVAEYIVVDPENERFALAAAGLTAISFALFLVLAAALRFTASPLTVMLPVCTLAVAWVSLRTLRLRIHNYWALIESSVIALIIVQLAAGVYYLPISPVSFGMALLGPAYALTTLMANLNEGEPIRQAITEPLIVLFLIWGVALWIR